jgi:hypothetical protein
MKVLTQEHKIQLGMEGQVDPRANSAEKLEAPFPLPFVSRKALKRVKSPLPVPETCRYCGPNTQVFYGHHEEVYGYGRSYGDWPYVLLCDNCESYVGLHPFTDIPLGILADAPLRKARKENKSLFHVVMQGAGMSRREAYTWLAGEMGIPMEQCHWGWFEADDCEKAGAICRAKMEEMTHGLC